jgi:hypothetical protein
VAIPAIFLPGNRDQRFRSNRIGYSPGETLAVDGECAAGGHLVGICAFHDQRAGHAHFRMNDTYRVVFGVIRAKRVRADQFRKTVGLVCIRAAYRPHFVQDDRQSTPGNLPGGFRACQTAADDMNGRVG